MWKVCIDKPFKNASKIFPTQQRDVARIVESVKLDSNVKSVTIFGSSVTWGCNPWSDIDVYYELKEEKKLPKVKLENPRDAWTNFTVDETLLEEIQTKGVVVYENPA